jgi:hypothetical protein
MMRALRCCLCPIVVAIASAPQSTFAEPASSPLQASPLGRFLLVASEGLYIVEADGTCSWDYTFSRPEKQTLTQFDDLIYDACALPNGNFLYSTHRYVREIDRQKQTVWEYRVEAPTEVKSFAVLPGGRLAILNSWEQAIIEMEPVSGKVLKRISVPARGTDHTRYNLLRRTPEGNYLVALRTENRFAEVSSADGREIRSFPVLSLPVVAERLADGTTVCSARLGLTRHNAKGEVIWSYTRTDAASEFPLIIASGFLHLPEDRFLVVNSDWHYKERDANRVQMFLVNADRKVLWTLPAAAFDGWKQSWIEPKTGLIEHRCALVQPLK